MVVAIEQIRVTHLLLLHKKGFHHQLLRVKLQTHTLT